MEGVGVAYVPRALIAAQKASRVAETDPFARDASCSMGPCVFVHREGTVSACGNRRRQRLEPTRAGTAAASGVLACARPRPTCTRHGARLVW